MKLTLKLLALSLLIVIVGLTSSKAQNGVAIPIQEYTLQIPTVNKLVIRPIGAPQMDYLQKADSITVDDIHLTVDGDTLQKVLCQPIYYELKRADGRTVETGNKSLPVSIYNLVYNYVDKTITQEKVNAINQFFVLADLPEIVALLPEYE